MANSFHDWYPVRSNIPECYEIKCRIEGTGAAAPTKKYGPGVTVTRTSEGLYRFSLAYMPGILVGFDAQFGAATPANMEGHSATHDDPVARSGNTEAYIEVSVGDAADALDDLEDEEYMTVTFTFSNSSIYALGDT